MISEPPTGRSRFTPVGREINSLSPLTRTRMTRPARWSRRYSPLATTACSMRISLAVRVTVSRSGTPLPMAQAPVTPATRRRNSTAILPFTLSGKRPIPLPLWRTAARARWRRSSSIRTTMSICPNAALSSRTGRSTVGTPRPTAAEQSITTRRSSRSPMT